jgi:hypothetical protein
VKHGLLLAILAGATGCRSGLLDAGKWGTFRYFAELEGEVPMRLIPPKSDREGNVYVLYEDNVGDSVVYTGQFVGGWSTGCQAHELPLTDEAGDASGLHGFIGSSDDRAWFWAGDALVEVDGATGQCNQVLDTDPLTITDLQFVGAIPWIHETPSRRTMVALVRGVSDVFFGVPPYQIVVDLDLGRYVSYEVFEPSDATCVDVIGVGSAPDRNEGVYLVAYNLDQTRSVEIRFVNKKGSTTATIPVDLGTQVYDCIGGESRPEPEILGFMQANAQGIYAGLLSDNTLLAFHSEATDGVEPRELPDYTPAGLVRFGGDLWVSGVFEDRPVVGKLDGSGFVPADSVRRWESAEKAASELNGKVRVLDQRYSPSEPLKWESPTSAIGAWPFLSPFPLDQYAQDTTGWIIAGPSFDSTSQTRTSVAYAPVGLSVP